MAIRRSGEELPYFVERLFRGLLAGGTLGKRDEGAVVFVRQVDGTNFAELVKVIAKILFLNRLVHDTTDV